MGVTKGKGVVKHAARCTEAKPGLRLRFNVEGANSLFVAWAFPQEKEMRRTKEINHWNEERA